MADDSLFHCFLVAAAATSIYALWLLLIYPCDAFFWVAAPACVGVLLLWATVVAWTFSSRRKGR